MQPLDWALSTSLGEIVATYLTRLAGEWGLLVLWVAALGLLASPLAGRWFAGASRALRAVLIAGLLIAGLFWARHLASLFDDACISLRYATNLAYGRGLVFNVGEHVEGYTNFLWTGILAGAIRLGIDGTKAAVFGCLMAFAAELLIVVRLSRLVTAEEKRPVIPIAAIILGASYTFASFGTTGMETMPATLLMTLALERMLSNRPGWSGFLGILAVLSHPDFALFYAGLGAAVLLDRERRRSILFYGAPFVLVYVPYFAWRWHYYGDFFPNTYYDKSANLTYFSQGFRYLAASGLACGLWALLPLMAFACWQRPRQLLTRFALLGIAPYLVYVTKIGGDFMLGRLIVPVLPVCCVLAEHGLRDLVATGRSRLQWVAIALLAVSAVPVRLLDAGKIRWYLTDERTWFPVLQLWPDVNVHSNAANRAMIYAQLARHGVHPIVGETSIGLTGLVSGLRMIDWRGLTDRTVAHTPLLRRGRPGHEKMATIEYMRSRGVTLSTDPLFRPPYQEYTHLLAGAEHESLYLGRYDPRLVKALRSLPGTQVPDLPAIIDDYVARATAARPPTLAQDVGFFDDFYFASNKDPDRQQRLHALQLASATAGLPAQHQ